MINLFSKILKILDKKEKFIFFILIILIILNTILELLSIGLIIPIISIIFSPDMLPKSIMEIQIIRDFVISKNFVVYLLSLMMGIYFMKNILLGLIHLLQTNYTFTLQKRISEKIFKNFLSEDYLFHIKNSKPKLIQIVIGETNNFIGRVITPIMILITELLVSLGILTIILMNNVDVLNLIYFLGLLLLIYYFVLKNKISGWGEDRRLAEASRIRIANEALQFIKEIKIFNKEIFFMDNFTINNLKAIEASKKLTYLNILPRILVEITVVSFLIFFLLSNLVQNTSSEKIISLLAIFAAASFRIMPSINRIMISFQSLRFGITVINPIFKNYNIKKILPFKEKNLDKINFSKLSIQNIKFEYEKNKKLFNEFNFTINKNEKIAIVGKSGSGKTTLLNLIIGFLKPLSGKIYLNNKILSSKDIFDWQQIIAYMPQKTCLTDDTILNNIRLDSKIKIDQKKLFKCLKESELIKDIKSNKIFLNRKVGEDGVNLSEGQRQRLSLARALYHDRQILILDEATSSLDKINERNILKTLSKLKNKTIIMVTHNKNNLRFFDKVFEIKNNKFSKL
jgi:ABC-type multidrug transport system fused ATPase/permease subunit